VNIADTILRTLHDLGQGAYFGEDVSECQHALQTAHLARLAAASDDLIVAALLHDIGHLLHGLPEDIAVRKIDGRHEDAGSNWLARYFPASVVDPVRLHVAAKRYLCAVEPAYLGKLSTSSQRSLELQGGPFDADEVRRFETEPFSREAVDLRRWDDAAKVPGWVVPGLEEYRSLLASAAFRGGAS